MAALFTHPSITFPINISDSTASLLHDPITPDRRYIVIDSLPFKSTTGQHIACAAHYSLAAVGMSYAFFLTKISSTLHVAMLIHPAMAFNGYRKTLLGRMIQPNSRAHPTNDPPSERK